MKRSFRLRLVIWTAGLACAVLAVFALVVWFSVRQGRLEQLDETVSNFGFRHVMRGGVNSDPDRLMRSFEEAFGERARSTRSFRMLAPSGELIADSAGWPESLHSPDFAPGATPLDPQPDVPPPPASEDRQRRVRTVMEPQFYEENGFRIGVFANSEIHLLVATDLTEVSDEMQSLWRAFGFALPGAILLIGLGAWFGSGRALRPINLLRENMRTVSAQSLDSRINPSALDREFAEIVQQYNQMLERLERSFLQATRFSADASHELKTPLAIMRGRLAEVLADPDTDTRTRQFAASLLEETEHQNSILENLLLLSRADSGRLTFTPTEVDLSGCLQLWIEDAGYLAEGRGMQIHSNVEPNLRIEGDESLLQQVAHNLFSNAVRHHPDDGGEIQCSCISNPNEVIWTVSNDCVELPVTDPEQLFQRFQKSASSPGTGLGLSLTKEIVTAHRGSISANFHEGQIRFTVRFPNISML